MSGTPTLWLSLWLVLGACSGERPETDSGTSESLPPPLVDTEPLDASLLLWSSETTLDTLPPEDQVFVVGLPGALSAVGGLTIANTGSGQAGSSFAHQDGSFVGVVDALLGDEIQVLVATEDVVRRGPVALEPANTGPELPTGVLWRVQPALDSAVLNLDVFVDWDLPVVIFQTPSGSANLWAPGDTAPSVEATQGSFRCAFAIDGELPGPVRCEESL